MQSKLGLVSLVALFSCAWCAVPLYPFGPGAGDRKLSNSADPAVTLQLNEEYVFYGENYKKLCISDNGYVTFGSPLTTNIPKTFPIMSGSHSSKMSRMLAVYWSDVDTRCGGDIWYRQVNLELEDDLYFRIYVEVDNAGVAHGFKPTSAVIITWEGVMCQNGVPCLDQRRNTFQLVLASDGPRTIVMYRYRILEWETSSAHSIPVRGPATAGVNAGDLSNGFNVTNNLDDMRDMKLVSMTNCKIPGLFIYRLDLGPSTEVKAVLMGQMMEMAVAETMKFGVAQAEELYSPFADVAASEFNRQEQVHLEEYVGGLIADAQVIPFYPYGQNEDGDSTLGSSDEGTSGKIPLLKPICYYGQNYTTAVVYTNGFVTLGGFYDFPTYKPKDLKETKVPMAAPYFADADSRGYKSGMVYYRWTDDTALLNRAKQDIGVSDFSPDSLLIATWDKIGFYNHHDNMLNSYQAVLASNGKTTYVILIYDRVEWSSPDSTGVTPGAGVGAEPSKLPVLGIGDGFSDEQLIDPSPRDESKILNVETSPGNNRFGIPGFWIFEASSSRKSIFQSSPEVDPKMQFFEYHRPSRPYVSAEQQANSEIQSLASELQDAKNYQRG